MSIRVFALFAGLLLLLLLAPLRAEHSADYPFYGGFALGFSSADSNCDHYGYSCDGTDTAFKVYAGKRLHRNIGLEIAFHDLGTLREENRGRSVAAKSQGVNLSLLGIIPASEWGYFYGKAGYMAWDADYTLDSGSVSDDGGDFTYGLGFALSFDPQYEFRVEFERLNELGDEFVAGGAPVTVFYLGGTINFY